MSIFNSKKGVAVKLNKRNVVPIVILLVILVAFFVAYRSGFLFYKPYQPLLYANISGQILKFRDDLREADKILVIPNESTIRKELFNENVNNITIVFKPNTTKENAYYEVEVIEIVRILAQTYKIKITSQNVIPVDTYENLNATAQNPVIALISPAYANGTDVRLEDHAVFIEGKDFKSFDLATIKFLMSALEISL